MNRYELLSPYLTPLSVRLAEESRERRRRRRRCSPPLGRTALQRIAARWTPLIAVLVQQLEWRSD